MTKNENLSFSKNVIFCDRTVELFAGSNVDIHAFLSNSSLKLLKK